MDRPIVSVIIPVYNVEDYIEKAVNSICSQTLTDWEMFLVDDGSTDGSGIICDNLASNESRIHVIHQENKGAAAARNAGMESAQGKYLYFMDGDDWATADMLYDMVCLAENYYLDAWAGIPVDNRGRNLDSIGQRFQFPAEKTADVPDVQCAQMVIAGFYIETYYSETDYYIQKQSVKSAVYGAKSEFRDVAHQLFDRNLLYTVWNKLYLTSYIREQGIRFQDGHWDDFPFNMDVIRNVERVSVTEAAYYHFSRKRQESESEKYNPGLYLEREQEHKNLIGLYESWHDEVEAYLLAEMKAHQPELTRFDEPGMNGTPLKQPAAPSEESAEVPEQEEKTEAAEPAQATENESSETAENVSKAPDSAANPEVQTETASEKTKPESASTEEQSFLPGQLTPPSPVVNIPSTEASEFISRRYLERIIGCIENISNPDCTMSKKEKKSEIKSIINSDTVREALKNAKPGSAYMKAMLIPLRLKSTSLTLLEGNYISRVRRKNKKTFAKLKANR